MAAADTRSEVLPAAIAPRPLSAGAEAGRSQSALSTRDQLAASMAS